MPKVVVIGLVAVGVLFFVIIAGGATRDDGNDSSDTDSSLVDKLEDALLGELERIPPESVATDCPLVGDRLTPPSLGECTVQIPPSGTPVRALRLLPAGGTISLVLAQEGNVSVKKDLIPEEEDELRVFKKGGSLTLKCADTTECSVQIKG